MRPKSAVLTTLIWLSTSTFIAVIAQTNSVSKADSLSVLEFLLEFLKIILSWPVIIFFVALIFRKSISDSVDELAERMSEFRYKDIVLNLKDTVKGQEEKIDYQQEIINKLVVFSMSSSIFDHLKNIYYRRKNSGEYLYHNNEAMRREMYYLRDNGFIKKIDNSFVDFDESLDGKDLVKIIELTPIGNFLVELRETM